MEKVIELNPREMQSLNQMQQEHLQLTARYGELRMNLDEAEKRIRESQGSQRSFIQNVMANHDVDGFLTARVEGQTIRYTVADPPSPRPNGEAGPFRAGAFMTGADETK